jgi:acetyl esterase/lipase
MKKMFLIILTVVLLAGNFGCQTSPNEAEMQTVLKEEGIVFWSVDGIDLKLDLARPGNGRGPYPALVFIRHDRHIGNRQACAWETEVAAVRGYVAVSIDYRTAEGEGPKSEYPFPAQLHDAKCAVRWLRRNAEHYDIDTSRIGAFGYGVGGHLALMLGLTDSSHGMEGECGDLNVSSQVQAVVNISGMTDLANLYEKKAAYGWYLIRFVGGHLKEIPEAYKLASPVTYVSEGDPPVLSVYGKAEAIGISSTLPSEQPEYLEDRMNEIGVPHTLVILEDKSDYLDIAADYPVWDFFDEHLKGRK